MRYNTETVHGSIKHFPGSGLSVYDGSWFGSLVEGDVEGDVQRERGAYPPVEMVPERKLLPMLICIPAHSVNQDVYRPE